MQVLEKQFSNHFHAYYRPLWLHALHFMGSTEEAEDVVQETFVNLWDKREELETIKSVRSYLYTAVRNNCLTRIRDAKPTTTLDRVAPDEWLSEEEQVE